MKKLIIFDLDGTILNTLPTIAYYGNLALRKNGFDTVREELYKSFLGYGRVELIHRMLGYNGIDNDENYENVAKVYDDAYINNTQYLASPYEGICDMLDELKDMGILVAVLSNKPHDVTVPTIEGFFPDVFCSVWGKKDGYSAKPNPEAAFEICRETGISPEETVFVGDTEVDIQTGKNAGFCTIGVTWGFREREDIEKCGADYIVCTPSEIPKVIKVKGMFKNSLNYKKDL